MTKAQTENYEQHEQAFELLKHYIDYLMEHSSAEAPAWNLEKIRSGKPNKWNYIDGCMIRGVLELYEITKEERYLDFSDRFVSGFVQEDGSIRTYDPEEESLDNVNPARNLSALYDLTGKERYRRAMDTVRAQLDIQPRTASGNFWHKKIYPDQVWLDGIYMAQPFYLEYERRFQNGAGMADSLAQFKNVEKFMKDPETGLYYHGYDESRKMYWADPVTGCSPNFWLRALGWFMLGLADSIEIFRRQEMKEAVEVTGRMFRDLTASLRKRQDPSGLFYQLVNLPDLPGNYLETSGTALISAAVLKGVRNGDLPEEFEEMGQKAFYGICDQRLSVNEDGTPKLGGICLVAGLGGETHRDGSTAYYLSEPVVENDAKGVGPFILAYTEMLRRTEAPKV